MGVSPGSAGIGTRSNLAAMPPAQATEDNDSLLTSSEIAQLKLDADWVLLSACNTAASDTDAPNGEALRLGPRILLCRCPRAADFALGCQF
jgi:hypothetical protein